MDEGVPGGVAPGNPGGHPGHGDGIGRGQLMTNGSPSPNGSNGRGRGGKFAPGNKGGPGNPFAARVNAWRTQLAEALSDQEFAGVIQALIQAATAGEPWAVREVLDRSLGKPVEADFIERLESLEAALRRGEQTCRD
jgi:hypothetical protein